MPEIYDKLATDISPEDYQAFVEFLEYSSGILLGENKQYLVENRLASLLDVKNNVTLGRLLSMMKTDDTLRQQVIDAMTTNETFWFRDGFPFEILKKRIFPELSQLNRPLKIWSSACSTGQETYSIMMSVLEYNEESSAPPVSVSIKATDLSERALKIAKGGQYDELSLSRGLTEHRRLKFFENAAVGAVVKEQLRENIEFQSFNLLTHTYNHGPFDVVFCRNVLIYFSAQRKIDVLRKMAAAINPGGYLFLGASEAISAEHSPDFQMINCQPGIVYQRR